MRTEIILTRQEAFEISCFLAILNKIANEEIAKGLEPEYNLALLMKYKEELLKEIKQEIIKEVSLNNYNDSTKEHVLHYLNRVIEMIEVNL